MWRLGLVALLVASTAPAATWTCTATAVATPSQLVLSRCTASGTYTAGGDPLAEGPSKALCGRVERLPSGGVHTTAESATTGEAYVVILGKVTQHVYLATSAKVGPEYALGEVAGGTSIDGATFTALTLCK